MANDNQFRSRTQMVATRGVREYRETIPSLIRTEDVVLEVGCGWGTTTAVLARHAKAVLGTDVSRECIVRAQDRYPTLDFRVMDAFDLRAVLDLAQPFSAVYVDLSGLSGYRGLLDLIALLNTYAAMLEPRVIVVKSGALRHFAQHCQAWSPPESRLKHNLPDQIAVAQPPNPGVVSGHRPCRPASPQRAAALRDRLREPGANHYCI